MPEHRWRPLFGPTSTLYAQDDHYRTLAYLCKEGILARWAPIGNVLTQPEVQYGPTETPRKGSRMQISLSYEGVTHVPNIWGERACHCAHLFEILKRYRDPVSGEYAPFASVPYASMEKTVPLKELQYVGVGGRSRRASPSSAAVDRGPGRAGQRRPPADDPGPARHRGRIAPRQQQHVAAQDHADQPVAAVVDLSVVAAGVEIRPLI